jgi:hypothetical protein
MKQVHRRSVSTASRSRSAGCAAGLIGFEVINGTPPGPSDPFFTEILAPPHDRYAGAVAAGQARHCRGVAR